jgi:NADH-quinone oxidoreductase subunit N
MIFYLLALILMILGSSVLLLATRPLDRQPAVPAGIALGTAVVAFMLFALSYPHDWVLLGMLRTGGLASLGGMIMTLIVALTALGALANPGRYRTGISEFYAFLLYTGLGGVLMTGANNILLLYVALELSAYSTYVLTGYYRDDRYSTEAAGKYFVLGALSSALLLYGLSFVFGAGGGIYYDEIARTLALGVPALFWPGMALVLVGVGFKLALVPFHAWTPDAYQGAPTMVAALLSVGPKAAVVIAFGSFFTLVLDMPDVARVWQGAFLWLAILTMTVGNLQALRQTNLKRLLGYSSVAQLGTITVGLAAGTVEGFGAVLFYAVAYVFSNIGAFTSIGVLRDAGVRETLTAYEGLGRRAPQAAFLFTIFLLSLAGVPLLAGFTAKLFVFKSAVDAGLITLALIAVLNTVLAYVYYFRVIITMWLTEPDEAQVDLPVGQVGVTALAVCMLGVFLLGMLPGATLDFIAGALEPLRAGWLVTR